MIKNRMFYNFLLLVSLNIFGMNNPAATIDLCRVGELALSAQKLSTSKVYDATDNLLAFLDNQAVMPDISKQMSGMTSQSLVLSKHTAANIREALCFPEIGHLQNYLYKGMKDDVCLNQIRENYAIRYVFFMSKNPKSLSFFQDLSIKNPVLRVSALQNRAQQIQNYINRCKKAIAHNRGLYENTGRIHFKKRGNIELKIRKQEKNLAKARGEQILIEYQIKHDEKFAEVANKQNFEQVSKEYKAVIEKNSTADYVTIDDRMHEKILNEQRKIAEKTCVVDSKLENRVYDISYMNTDFLKEFDIDKNDLEEMFSCNGLHDYIHKRGIYYLKRYETMWQKFGDFKHIRLFIDKGVFCAKKGIECNKVHNTVKASKFFDVSRSILDVLKNTVDTIGEIGLVTLDLGELTAEAGLSSAEYAYRVISDIALNGDKHVDATFKGALDGTDSIVKATCNPSRENIKEVIGVVGQALEVVNNFFELCITAITDPSVARSEIQAWKNDLRVFMETIRSKKEYIDVTEVASKFAAKGLLFSEGVILARNLCRAMLGFAYKEVTGRSWFNTAESVKEVGIQSLGEQFAARGASNVNLYSEQGRSILYRYGPTGRTVAKNLQEQLAMKEVMSNPLPFDGEILRRVTMSDPRWLANEGWVKVAKNVEGVEIHYVWNKLLRVAADFKYKN